MEIITSEDLIAVICGGFSSNKYDIETNTIGYCNAIRVCESGLNFLSKHDGITYVDDVAKTFVMVTADTSALPYYVDEPVTFVNYDSYMICRYSSDDVTCNTVKGLENIVGVIKALLNADN